MTQLTEDATKRLDAITEHEVALGYRIVAVPKDIQLSFVQEEQPVVSLVRFSAVNPARRRYINEAVQQRYHRDLMNEAIYSNAQVKTAAEKRGEWSPEQEARMEELRTSTQTEMMRLWAEGVTAESSTLGTQITALGTAFLDHVAAANAETLTDAQKTETEVRFGRWVNWRRYMRGTPAALLYADAAADQGLEEYSEDRDFAWLGANAPSVEDVDLLNHLEELRDKQTRLVVLTQQRVELAELQARHARLFAGTAESRQSHAEEMAQLYFTCEQVDANGKPTGKLAKTFDGLYDFPDVAIRWLLWESYFFHSNVPPEYKSYFETFGFMDAERKTTTATAPQSETPADDSQTAPSSQPNPGASAA